MKEYLVFFATTEDGPDPFTTVFALTDVEVQEAFPNALRIYCRNTEPWRRVL
jgi:hypothetical protein